MVRLVDAARVGIGGAFVGSVLEFTGGGACEWG